MKTYIKQGDCLELMKEIPDKSIDMVLCDLPYNMTDCEWDKQLPFSELWQEYSRITKDNSAIVLFSIQPFTTKMIQSNLKYFRYCWYWKKNNATGGQFAKVQPMRCIEDICVFYKHKPPYNPQGLVKLEKPIIRKDIRHSNLYDYRGKAKPQYYTNYPKNLIEFNRDKEYYHPTQKPVPLLEYLIKTYTNEGQTVLDNCMGSGSTGVAAVNTGRQFIGFELNPQYYETAKNRIEQAQRSAANI